MKVLMVITSRRDCARDMAITRQQGGGGAIFGAIGLFVLAYAGMAISLYPMIVPYQLTLWEAASSPRTQAFLLVGTLFLLPVILTYSGWSYWVFRGKVRPDAGYS
jgi:cytochrome bd ubiquinol oxidase subunit II